MHPLGHYLFEILYNNPPLLPPAVLLQRQQVCKWKCAAIKLILKESATEDVLNPVALRACIGKLFTALFRNHCRRLSCLWSQAAPRTDLFKSSPLTFVLTWSGGWWDGVLKSLHLVELTVSYETNFVDGTQRETVKYFDLVEQAHARIYETKPFIIERWVIEVFHTS